METEVAVAGWKLKRVKLGGGIWVIAPSHPRMHCCQPAWPPAARDEGLDPPSQQYVAQPEAEDKSSITYNGNLLPTVLESGKSKIKVQHIQSLGRTVSHRWLLLCVHTWLKAKFLRPFLSLFFSVSLFLSFCSTGV
jgi:hypothetical protein